MNIVILTGLYPTEDSPSGGLFIYERLRELQKTKNQFQVYAISRRYSIGIRLIYKYLLNTELKNHKIVPWDDEIKLAGIYEYINIPMFLLSLITPNLYWKLKKKILLQRIPIASETIIHAHWAYPHGFFAVKLAQEKKTKAVITCHGSDIHSNPNISPLLRKITVDTIHLADKTIFVSRSLLSSAKKLGYDGKNSIVIPNGINIEKFNPIDKKIALRKTGWKQTERYVVGFVGNLITVKRADKFIEIFSEIQRRVKSVEFVLVGDGDLADKIRQGCSQCGISVTITGYIPNEDVCNWINLFDVMILPSRKESWGCVIQEAYACGVPVVGSAIGGIPENLGGVCPCVVDGDYFEERFAQAVSEVLTGKITIEPETLISCSKENKWSDTVKNEIDVYHELIK